MTPSHRSSDAYRGPRRQALARALFLCSAMLLLSALPARAQNAQSGFVVDPQMCALPIASLTNAAPSQKAKDRARIHITTARNAYLKHDFAAAITELQAAYELDPLVDVLFNIAQACREAGLEREALLLYEKVLKQSPLPEQEASRAKIAELHAKLAETESARADKALENKLYDEASAGFQRAYDQSPKPIYLFRLGETLRLAGRYSEAIAAYERVLQTAPKSATATDARRQLSGLKAQQADEAATLHYGKGEFQQAITEWDMAYQQEARPIFLFRQAEAMRQAQQGKQAAAEYERFLRESPQTDQPELRQQAQAWVKELRQDEKEPPPATSQQPGSQTTERRPIYKRWWFWTAIGGGMAVVATGVALGVVLSSPKTLTPPDGVMVLMTSF